MNDRELLEMAAKAAGYEIEVDHHGVIHHHDGSGPQSWVGWNPLDDDGDALRLAVKLGLLIDCDDVLKDVEAVLVMRDHDDQYVRMNERYGDDPCAATRRAIVRAAAAIGREMK